MPLTLRPLNAVHKLMNEMGFDPGYAYDDLVFSNDAVFIVQFDSETDGKLKLFINQDCEISTATNIKKELLSCAVKQGIIVRYCGTFKLNFKEETELIEIKFNSL
jgi:hypothetical protein